MPNVLCYYINKTYAFTSICGLFDVADLAIPCIKNYSNRPTAIYVCACLKINTDR